MTDESPAPSIYVHGSHDEEQARLSRMNELINDATLAEIRIRPGARVLDVGCGLAQFSRLMARAAGAPVVGVERDAAQRAEGARQADAAGEADLVDVRAGDALDLPLASSEWGTFDVAHTRFLLEHVREPQRVVDAMARAVRPGGRVVLADDDHDVLRLSPEPEGFVRAWDAYMATYARAGNDAFVGRRLVTLLHRAGAKPVRNTWVFFGACAGDDGRFSLLARNLIVILEGARAAMIETGRVDAAACDVALRALEAWSALPDAAIWYPICWAEGRVEPSSADGGGETA